MKLNRHTLPLAWGLLHGINDWVAGYMIANYSLNHSLQQMSIALMIYTLLGFGGQLPVGMYIDKSRNLNPFIHTSLILLVISIPGFWLHDLSGIILAGFSSAFLHVTGGSICLQTSDNKTSPLGIFTAPGVLGLTLGIASATLPSWCLAAAIVGVALVLIIFRIRINAPDSKQVLAPASPHKLIEGHDWIMIAILLAATFRSFLYEVINMFSHNWQEGLLAIGISAFAGKIIGGFLADRIGWKRWVYITLPLAFLLLQLGHDNVYMLGFGIACLQSSVPISLMLMRRSMPDAPGSATALTLGIAIALSGSILFIFDRLMIAEGWFTYAGLIGGIILMIIVFLFIKKIAKAG